MMRATGEDLRAVDRERLVSALLRACLDALLSQASPCARQFEAADAVLDALRAISDLEYSCDDQCDGE